MSTLTFPTLAGLGWSVIRRPIWKSLVQETASGKSAAAGLMLYPLWEWELTIDLLRVGSPADYQTLVGFINRNYGRVSPFYFTDQNDKSVTNQSIGIGDGSNKDFQLVRTFGNFTEPVQSKNGSITVKVNGSTTTDYTITSTGLITFTVAPGVGKSVTWTGSYFWLCRFNEDETDFEEFMSGYATVKKLAFRYVKQ